LLVIPVIGAAVLLMVRWLPVFALRGTIR
jgi:hypothetical protein